MTRLERIARDLAAVLSPRGEEDWGRYVRLAEEVSRRLDRQFADIMVRDAEPGYAPWTSGRNDFTRRRKPPSGRRI
jgi:hypothetical protein